MITRRLDRDGKSEYLINSNVCRLKDVQEIFMDTGVGARRFWVYGARSCRAVYCFSSREKTFINRIRSGVLLNFV